MDQLYVKIRRIVEEIIVSTEKKSLLDCIGNTPLVSSLGFDNLYFKLETMNPGGSIKDRTALGMINYAEQMDMINSDSIIIEATAGNTGLGLALVCSHKGYQLKLVIPENMSIARIKTLKQFGADIIYSPERDGMFGAVEMADSLASENNFFQLLQFENPANPQTHFTTTGPEILADLPDIDIFVTGIGTGGTISGVGRYLKEKKPGVIIVGLEPAESPYLTKQISRRHKIEGIGAGFRPMTLDLEVIDHILPVEEDDAFDCARILARAEGIMAGISSGANLWGAIQCSRKYPGKKIATLICDSAQWYLDTELFD